MHLQVIGESIQSDPTQNNSSPRPLGFVLLLQGLVILFVFPSRCEGHSIVDIACHPRVRSHSLDPASGLGHLLATGPVLTEDKHLNSFSNELKSKRCLNVSELAKRSVSYCELDTSLLLYAQGRVCALLPRVW